MSEQSPQKSIQRIRIKQFEWLQLEIKMRECLAEMFDPFAKKQKVYFDRFEQMSNNVDEINKKVSQHEFYFKGNNSKPIYVSKIEQRLSTVQQKLVSFENQSFAKIKEIVSISEIFEEKMKSVAILETRMNNEIKERIEKFNEYKKSFDQTLGAMNTKIMDNLSDTLNFKQIVKNNVNKVQAKVCGISDRIEVAQMQLKVKNNQVKSIIQKLSIFEEKISILNLKVKQIDERLKQRQSDEKLSEKFMSKMIETQNQVTFLSNYLSNYQPLYIQMQISESLNSCLRGAAKIRCCIFEQKIFALLHSNILNSSGESLETRMSEFSNRIKNIINRNKKHVIKLKVEETFQYGNNIYEIRQKFQNFSKDYQQQPESQKKIAQPSQIVFSSLPSEKMNEIQKQIKQKFSTIMANNQAWLKQLQQQHLLKQLNFQEKYNKFIKQFEINRNNYQLMKSDIHNIEKSISKNNQRINKYFIEMKEYMKDLLNFCSILNHMAIQPICEISANDSIVQKQKHQNLSITSGAGSQFWNQHKDKPLSHILQATTGILTRIKSRIEGQDRMDLVSGHVKATDKSKSKSLAQRQPIIDKQQHSTIDIPVGTRLSSTMYILPTLSSRRRASIVTPRDRNNA